MVDALHKLTPGSFLEVGCGRGELLPWLDEMGYSGLGLEISESVLPIARGIANQLGGRIDVVDSLEAIGARSFDYVLSFEVLEHLEDDHGWLSQWLQHLGPDGRFVCTVPSHMKLWSSADEAVGHVRRYERTELIELLERNGLEVEVLWSFGYPLVLITRPLRHLLHRLRSHTWSQSEMMDRTLESAWDSTIEIPGPLRVVVRALLEASGVVFNQLGRLLRGTDWGDGYLVVARWR